MSQLSSVDTKRGVNGSLGNFPWSCQLTEVERFDTKTIREIEYKTSRKYPFLYQGVQQHFVRPPRQIHTLPNRSVTLLGILQYTHHNKYTPFQIDQLPSQDYYSTPATTNTHPSKQISYSLRTTIVHPPQQIHTLPNRSVTLLGLLQYTHHNKYTPFQIDQLPSQDYYSTPTTTNTRPSKQISYPLRTTIVHSPQQIHALPNRSVTLLGLLQYTHHNKYTPFQIDQLPSQDYCSTPATINTHPSKQISYPLRTTIVHPPQQIHTLPNRSVTLLGLLQYTRHNKYTPFQIDQLPSQDYYSTPATTNTHPSKQISYPLRTTIVHPPQHTPFQIHVLPNTHPSKQISYPLRTTIVHPPQQIHALPNRSVTLLGLLQYTRHNKYTPFQIDQLPSQDYYSTPATTNTHPSKQISYPLRTTIVHPPQQIHTLPNRSVTLLGLLQYTRHNKYTPFQIDQLPSQDYYSTPTTTNTRPSKQISYPLRTTIVHPPQQIHALPNRSVTLLGLLQYTRHNKYTPFQIDQLPSQDYYSTPATTNTHPSKQISYPLRTTIVHPPQQIHTLPNRSVTLLGLLQYTRHNKYTPFQIDQLPSQDYYSTPTTTNTRPSKQISYPLRTTIVHPPQQIHALPNRSVTLLGLLQYTRHNKYTPFQIDQLPSQDYYSTPATTNTHPSKQISYPLRTTIVHPPQQIHTLPNRSVTLLGLLQYIHHNKYMPFQIDQLPSQDYYSTPTTTNTRPSKQISYPLRTTIVHPNTTINTRPSKQISYPLRTTIVHPPQQIHALPNRSVTLLGLLQYTRHNKYTPFQIDQLPSQDYYSTPATTNTHPSKQISYPLRTTIVHPPQQIHTLPNRSVTLLGLLQYTRHNKYMPFQIDQLPSQDYYSTPATTNTALPNRSVTLFKTHLQSRIHSSLDVFYSFSVRIVILCIVQKYAAKTI